MDKIEITIDWFCSQPIETQRDILEDDSIVIVMDGEVIDKSKIICIKSNGLWGILESTDLVYKDK